MFKRYADLFSAEEERARQRGVQNAAVSGAKFQPSNVVFVAVR